MKQRDTHCVSSDLRRSISMLLCLFILVGLFPVNKALAGDTNGDTKVLDNVFLLHVATGANAGDGIEYFAIHYVDKDGDEHIEYLMLNDDIAEINQRILSEVNLESSSKNQKQKVMENLATMKLPTSNGKLLQVESTDDILFRLSYEFKSFVGIDLLMNKGTEWTSKGIELYKVDSIYDSEMEGYYSTMSYLDFSGTSLGYVRMDSGAYSYNSSEKNTLFPIRADSTFDGRKLVNSEDGYATTKSKTYFLKMDVADVSGAGFTNLMQEALTAKKLSEMNLYEELVAAISYYTVYGAKKTIYIPVISSMMCYLIGEKGLGNEVVFGIGTQGASLFCPIKLPRIDDTKTVSIKMYFGNQAANRWCGSPTSGASKDADKTNNPHISGIQIYDITADDYPGSDVAVSIESYIPKVDLVAFSAKWFITATTMDGWRIAKDSGTSIGNLKECSEYENVSFVPTNRNTQFLVTIDTDTVPNAGTEQDLYVSLTYSVKKIQNSEVVTEERTYGPVNLREEVNDFYGDWPTKPAGGAYLIGASSGNSLKFLISLSLKVGETFSKWNGMNIYMRDGYDDYQFTGISIYPVNSVEGLAVDYIEGKNDENNIYHAGAYDINGIQTNWLLERKFDTQKMGLAYKRQVLVQRDSEKSFEFSDSDQTAVKEIELDWEEYKYNMSYEAAAYQDLGLSKTRATYEVAVKVHDDADSDLETGDSGSKNMFYFQLVFENGMTSGYVLANQQISAGRFRSDKTETFNIFTAYDYGDLAAIRIIPDDTVQEGETFDKLYLEYVQVTKQTSTSVSPVWQFDINGWIDINYVDTGAKTTSTGLSGRTEGEIARTFRNTGSSYSINLLCEFTTEEADAKLPYTGSLYALVIYDDVSGKEQKKYIDVGYAMYLYQGRKNAIRENTTMELPSSEETDISKFSELETGLKGVYIDTSTMLREGDINRFVLNLVEPKKIKSVEFFTHTITYSPLKFSFHMYEIPSGSGDLYLDEKGAYQRMYDMEPLCKGGADYYETSGVSASGDEYHWEGITVYLEDHEIVVNSDYELASTIGKESSSKNDTLNVYVYMCQADKKAMKTSSDPTDISKYDMNLEVIYNGVDYENNMLIEHAKQSVKGMNKNVSKQLFYAKGIPVSGISTLENLKLRASGYDIENYNCLIAVIVVEHIRNNVLIKTLYYNCGAGGDANMTNSDYVCKPSASNYPKELDAKTSQNILIQFSHDIEPFTVTKSNDGTTENDIGIILHYKTVNAISDMDVLDSKTVMLSDLVGRGESRTFNPGEVVTLGLSDECIQQIMSFSISALDNDLQAAIEGVCVGLYSTDGSCKASYGPYDKSTIKPSARLSSFVLKENATVPVTLTITTAEATSENNTSCKVPVKVELHYEDEAGSDICFKTDELQKYIQSGDLTSGNTATIMLLLNDYYAMHYATFTLVEKEENKEIQKWQPSKIVFRANNKDGEDKINEPTTPIYEGKITKINLSNIQMGVGVQTENNELNYFVDEPVSLSIKSGGKVNVVPYIGTDRIASGSFEDVDVTVKKVVNGAEVNVEEECIETSLSKDGVIDLLTFTPPRNYTGSPVIYNLILTSQEVGSKVLIITVTVDFEEPPEEENPTEENPTEENPTEENPTEENPTEENPTEENPTEENPTEENPTEENPTEENPTEENPTEENPTEENPTEENPTEENPTEENPTEQPPLEEDPAERGRFRT